MMEKCIAMLQNSEKAILPQGSGKGHGGNTDERCIRFHITGGGNSMGKAQRQGRAACVFAKLQGVCCTWALNGCEER